MLDRAGRRVQVGEHMQPIRAATVRERTRRPPTDPHRIVVHAGGIGNALISTARAANYWGGTVAERFGRPRFKV